MTARAIETLKNFPEIFSWEINHMDIQFDGLVLLFCMASCQQNRENKEVFGAFNAANFAARF